MPRDRLVPFLAEVRADFRAHGADVIYGTVRLIDLAIGHGGSFYLTYHRFATRQQVAACYPQFAHFLRLKRQYDPDERFQSDWYQHDQQVFGGEEDGA